LKIGLLFIVVRFNPRPSFRTFSVSMFNPCSQHSLLSPVCVVLRDCYSAECTC